jgi:hypothetical protein
MFGVPMKTCKTSSPPPEEDIVRYNLGGIVGDVWSLPATFHPGAASG